MQADYKMYEIWLFSVWDMNCMRYDATPLKVAKIVSFLLSEKWLDGVYEDFCWDFFCIFTHAIQLPNLNKLIT